MADRGYREIISYAFVDPLTQQQLFPDTPTLKLANPISADLSEMRVSLWPGLINACRENLRRQQTRVRLFEIGSKFNVSKNAPSQELQEIETLARHCNGNTLAAAVGQSERSGGLLRCEGRCARGIDADR